MTAPLHAAFLSLLALPGATQAAPAEPVPLYQPLKDWVVGCDNTRECTALAADTRADMPLGVQVVRGAGSDGQLQVTIYSRSSLEGPLQLDGKPLALPLNEAQDNGVVYWHASGEQAMTLLKALRNGSQLTSQSNDGQLGSSLNGLSASLLLIDSVQGRVGHRSAFVRPGVASDSAVPPAPALPKLAPFVRPEPMGEAEARRITEVVMAATAGDWRDPDADWTPDSAQAYALSRDTALVSFRFGCGAYNCEYVLYTTSRAHPEQAKALQFENIAGQEQWGDFGGSVGYDPDTGVLSSFILARGIGDCGVDQSWRFDGERMQLRSLARMGSCSASWPDKWPVLWRTQD
ncbi:DUF1176 domain-containing protein [Pseudomonas sp. LF19]|uniref:DUF1176 domain-containing protein n=1 Tax=Pseudomonas sp. LF19 TaxID=2899115 RepID=UPI001F21A053|nr:DUF1176 domain-containing protein [Pseudomonas sp. LF19]MCE5982633.1 DUF1176 domain-containing protein [Pseudomonas sp. LF19]